MCYRSLGCLAPLLFLNSCRVEDVSDPIYKKPWNESPEERNMRLLHLSDRERIADSDIPEGSIAHEVMNAVIGTNYPGARPTFTKRFEHLDATLIENFLEKTDSSSYFRNTDCPRKENIRHPIEVTTAMGVFSIPGEANSKRFLRISVAYGLPYELSPALRKLYEDRYREDRGFICMELPVVLLPPLNDKSGGGFRESREWINRLIKMGRILKKLLGVKVEEVVGRKEGSRWSLSHRYTYEIIYT